MSCLPKSVSHFCALVQGATGISVSSTQGFLQGVAKICSRVVSTSFSPQRHAHTSNQWNGEVNEDWPFFILDSEGVAEELGEP